MNKKIETENKLIEALDRILSNNNIYTEKGKKLSFSLVEDEARVGRSLLRSYPNVFEKVKIAIFLEKEKKNNKNTIINKNRQSNEKKNLRDLNNKLKEDNAKLKEKNEILLKSNIGMAERIYYLEKLLSNKKEED